MASRIGDINCWVRIFEVSEPTKHRKGFTVYKVTSTVFPKAFPESATKIVVWKRYSDFQKLHKELEQIFQQLYLKGQFPPIPKAKYFGRFEHEVVEVRRNAALELLEFSANHMQLFTSKAFIQFFENGYSTQDFLGKVLFRNGEPTTDEDPPTTVHQEKSELNVPCLEPQKLWAASSESRNEDCVSTSSSFDSPTKSLNNSEKPLEVETSCDPCTSTSDVIQADVNGNNEAEMSSADSNLVASLEGSAYIRTANLRQNEPDEAQKVVPSHGMDATASSSTSTNTNRSSGIVRSATVTDDLNAYFDEEFEESAFLFPTGSCSSLDTLPGYASSTAETMESESSQSPKLSGASHGRFSLQRKKPTGFGLFDFLPLFQKKSKKKEKKEDKHVVAKEKETEKTSTLSVGYICEAAGHFAVAQFHESNADYADAFTAYKEGIRVLLAGAQDDSDRDRKILAKNKLEKYLSRAESLKELFLTVENTDGSGAISPVFSSPNKKQKSLSVLNRDSLTKCNKCLPSSLEDLKLYKVVGVGSRRSKIIVVMNPNHPSPKCYAAKVLWKSSAIVYSDKPNIIPGRVPFMVKLEKWFDTPDKIILLLEHAGGGRLLDFVTNYQTKRISFVSPPDIETPDEDSKELVGAECEHKPSATNGAPNQNKQSGTCDIESLDSALSQLNRTHLVPGVFDERPEENSTKTGGSLPSETPFLTPPEEDSNAKEILPEILSPDMDVSIILENSKMLLQNVAKVLEESKRLKNDENQSNTQDSVTNSQCSPEYLSTTDNQTEVTASQSSQTQTIVGSDSLLNECNPSTSKPTIEEEDSEADTPKRMVPEGCIKVWAAEVVLALEALHDAGITYGNLDVDDILLGENGHVLLKHKSLWKEIEDPIKCNSYMAPEVRDSIGIPFWKIHPCADWWSLGAILFLLISGQTFGAIHPEGVFQDMIIKIPDYNIAGALISKSARTLLLELLHHSPEKRLGFYGAAEIKTHPFFEAFDWNKAVEEWSAED